MKKVEGYYSPVEYYKSQGYTVEKSTETLDGGFWIIEKDGKQKTLDIFEYPEINRSVWRGAYQRLMKGGLFVYTHLGVGIYHDPPSIDIHTKKDIESKYPTVQVIRTHKNH